MAVYVDELIDYGWKLGPSCHMTADTPEELHDFAARLGMLRHWASDHTQPQSRLHYDLTRGKRMKALKLGAVERTTRERLQAEGRLTSAPPEQVAAGKSTESPMGITAGQPAPRFERGQRVRVTSNAGGLYGAQIGVVGVIERKRQYRRWSYHTYDVGYQDEKGRDKRLTSVREDDLEPVEAAVAGVAGVAGEPTTPAPFTIGDRVTVRPPADDQEEEYPSFTAYPVVGEIVSACQTTAAGVHCYDVRFPRIVGGVSSDWWPPVAIREAHLVPEPSRVGWLAHEAAMERYTAARTQASTKARTKTPAKAPTTSADKPPTFSVGEHITVDPRSALAYETFTRKGAVGKIVEIGKPVRGIRRYTVRYSTGAMTRIREEHLVKAEAPMEPPMPSEPSHDDGWGTWDDDAPMKAKEQADDAAYTAAYGDERPSRPVTPAMTPAMPPAMTPTACVHTWQVYYNHGPHRRCSRCHRVEHVCDHDWQVWPDGRYRHCPKCKLSERLPAATAVESEVAR